MQEIFYNGNIITNNDNNEVMEAMIINDGSVFFVGQNDEVLNLKTDETKVNEMNMIYFIMSESQKAFISEELTNKLTAAVDKIASLKA